MSTTQSQMHPGPQNTFQFNPTTTLTQMNLRQDGMRQPSGVPQLPPGVLNGQPQFMHNRQQSEQLGQSSIGMGNPNTNLPMGVLGGSTSNPSITQQQRMQAQVQHQRLLQQAQQAQHGQSMTPGGASGQPMGGLGSNQMGNIGFNPMMQPSPMNVQLRRVQSQPQSLNQPQMAQMQMAGTGVHPGQQGGMPIPTMGMNASTSMPGQMRQQMTMRQPGPTDLAMRQPGNPAMARDMQRSDSQIMGGLPQQVGLNQPHPGGVQPSLPTNGFPAPMGHSQHTMSPSPRLGPGSQPQTPANMNMANPSQGQPGMRNSQGDMFNFPGQSFSQGIPSNVARPNNPQFPLVPSSSPMNHGDGPLIGAPANNRPGGFQMTPAQQLQNGGDNFGNHFGGMPPPANNIPPRPPSNMSSTPLSQHQQAIHHASPGDHMSPQRPQSQPQGPPGRPPSQSGLSSTPRNSQIPLPPTGVRGPSLGQPSQPHQPQSASGHLLPAIAPRPAQPAQPIAGPSGLPPGTFNAPEGQPGGPPRPTNTASTYPLGLGQGLTRLLQFSGVLASDNKQRLSLAYWDALVKEYFANQAVMKLTLWKDNQRNEAKPFDIGVPILPRFFLVTAQSGVKTMSLSLDGARERLLSQSHAIIECVSAAWTYKYTNGYTVTLRGPLTAHIILVPNAARTQPGVQSSQPFTLKFDNLDFGANFHDKSISLESIMGPRNPESSPPKTPHQRNAVTPGSNSSSVTLDDDKKWEEPRVIIEHASIPGEPVNAFGIPQATMRCLELAESVGAMTDLIAFASEAGTGPIEGLQLYATKLREAGGVNGGGNGAGSGSGFQNFQTLNGVHPSPAVTLYSSIPPPAAPPAPQPQAPPTPQNGPPSATNSPRKQNKTVPQPPNSAATPGAASTSVTTPLASTSTPSMSNTSLKRKQGEASPTIEPSKRSTRSKRGRGA